MAKSPHRRSRLAGGVGPRSPAGVGILFHAPAGCCRAKPNPAHFALAKLEKNLEERLFLCTQNVDNLHEQAGSKQVVHMHGELFKSRCDTCSRPPFETSPSASRQRRFSGASAAARFARTSAGSVKSPLNWIAFFAH